MRDVVVIGGGLSGLSACYELEKQQLPYTVIEVKRRFGGCIRSTFEAGFIMDDSAFAFRAPAEQALLKELDLADQMLAIGDDAFIFRQGTESLINALGSRLRGGRLTLMAVSSIGRSRRRFTLCLENGIMLDAGALILAVPARYAARMLYNLAPEAAQGLGDFRYDTIRRISLGYHKRDLPARIDSVDETVYPFVLATNHQGRVPDQDHMLIQVGLRCPSDLPNDEAVRRATRQFGLDGTPLVSRVEYWPEADSLSAYDDAHGDNMRAMRDLLPAGIDFVGSDYCLDAPQARGIARLDERIRSGRRAARAAIDFVKAGKRR